MADASPSLVEPFVEQAPFPSASPEGRSLRIGYRIRGTDENLVVVELPVDVLEREFASSLRLVTLITPTGEVACQVIGSWGLALSEHRSRAPLELLVLDAANADSSQISISRFDSGIPKPFSESVPVDNLLERAMSAENLRLEEANIVDLAILLKRLERSINMVQEAIYQMESACSKQ